jgi:hypothetical protein
MPKAHKVTETEYYSYTRKNPDRWGSTQIARSRKVTTWTLVLDNGKVIKGFATKRQALSYIPFSEAVQKR